MEVALDGMLIARMLGIPHVLHYRGNTLDEPRVVFDVLVRLWTLTSRRVFCISKATAALFESRGQGSLTEVMYNPVDLQAFAEARTSAELRAEWAAGAPAPFIVGTVARIHPRKDLETFLRAAAQVAARIPSARFVVVGSAAGEDELAYAERLRALANHLGIESRITWAGARRDIPVVMNSLDLFVLTSRHEGFGRVVAEAMAAGCPVLVSNEGALPELIEDGRSGLQAHAGDPASFADLIESQIREPAERARLASAGRARSRSFDAVALAQRTLSTYRTLSGRPGEDK
jgi:glycosyltransferase involved in cell wall biosynthesis